MNEVYSYHTFILPFVWECNGNSQQIFLNYLEENANWVNTDMKDPYNITSRYDAGTREKCLTLYKEFQYFHPYARKAIYGQGEDIVHNYEFMPSQLHEKANYVITKDEKVYTLVINAIRLKVYNTGIALWILECENREPSQFNIDAVKDINDYGRRITLPTIDENFSLSADTLEIVLGDIKFTSDFAAYRNKIFTEEIAYKTVSMTHMCDIVKKTIAYGGTMHFSSKPQKDNNTVYLYSALDDRMFVMSYIYDPQYVSEKLGKTNEARRKNDPEYPYKKSNKMLNDLYELAYVDHSDGLSVENTKVRDALLEASLYSRWLNLDGSMYFITGYSFIYVTGSTFPPLLESFLTQYYQMFCLVIAQRSSIIKFKRAAVKLSSGLETRGMKMKKDRITKIMGLQQQFVTFDGQLCFEEASPQQQGIEIYDMLKNAFLIDKEKSALKEQLTALYEVANTSISFDINKVVLIFTWIAAIISIASMIISTLQIGGFTSCWNEPSEFADVCLSTSGKIVAGTLILTAITGFISWLVITINYRRRK